MSRYNRAARSQRAGARLFMGGDHSEAHEAWQVKPCRVCKLPIAIGEQALRRAWCTDAAHASCGWLRADERAPHECSGAELRRRLYEWACTEESCGRDVVRPAMPEAGADLRCRACTEKVGAT